jgi:hypothetical protein
VAYTTETPFDSIENAQDYIHLLSEAVAEAKQDIHQDIVIAKDAKLERRLQALQLVEFKLEKLNTYLKSSSRTLNDLRTLRRLLLEEREQAILVDARSIQEK